ncbi:MAG: endonuclease/exonuclease/phosphatase family protein [Candidatus Thorarchaeota archaeon]
MKSVSLSTIVTVLSIIFLIGTSTGLLLSLPRTPNTSSSEEITIMTYNIYQGYTPEGGVNLEQVRDTILAADADIVGLQESDTGRVSSMNLDTILWLSTHLDMYSYYGPPTSEQIIGVALLSRYPITSSSYHLLSYEELPRVMLETVIKIGTIDLTVFVVHLGLSYEDRTSEAEEVISALNAAPDPKILVGDFNTLPTGHPEPGVESPDDTIYHDISMLLNDSWTAAGNALDAPAGYTWPSVDPYERIDYIWVSPDVTVLSCAVITSAMGSDHLPVVARTRLS